MEKDTKKNKEYNRKYYEEHREERILAAKMYQKFQKDSREEEIRELEELREELLRRNKRLKLRLEKLTEERENIETEKNILINVINQSTK